MPTFIDEAATAFEEAKDQQLNKNYDKAYDRFLKASELLLKAYESEPREDVLNQSRVLIERAELIKSEILLPELKTQQKELKRLFRKAVDAQEAGDLVDAFDAYEEAIKLWVVVKKSRFMHEDSAEFIEFSRFEEEALCQMEMIQTKQMERTRQIPSVSTRPAEPQSIEQVTSSRGNLSKHELNVLKFTSNINGRIYLPFINNLDDREQWHPKGLFNDKDGLLALSKKQKAQFHRWARPSEIMSEPRMITSISSEHIKQTVVTDCSFIASMAVAARYEATYNRRLITNIIYPQKANGEPVYNPSGKYMVKLHINGVPRKVILDDLLPVDRHNQLLCSYSQPNELWVALLEKAYMKVMGGYDFPGSSSTIDLHALTGWIPERIAIRQNSIQFNRDVTFRRLRERYHRGHCLITVATGALSSEEAERAGLVPTHAYAVLDIREVQERRLFKLKNPWSHLRWRGNFSEQDTNNWTAELRRALNFDQEQARLHDNGVFWIDYDSLCHYFDVICVNWLPSMFPYTYGLHNFWAAHQGPKKDSYCSSESPQFRLTVKAKQKASIWILLTRHITDKEDFANNKVFIGLAVYKDVHSRKVYYPYDPEPLMDSQRINSPHCLLQVLQEEPGNTDYVLLISQYEKTTDIRFSLRVYCSQEIQLREIRDPYPNRLSLNGDWLGATAGGCANHPDSYRNNPRFRLSLDNKSIDNDLLLELKGPRDYSIGMELLCVTVNNSLAPNQFKQMTSGPYRRGYVMMELAGLSGGEYELIVSTFKPHLEGTFIIKVSCNQPVKFLPIRSI